MNNSISERIAMLIDAKRLSKTEFANTLKVTQPYISKIINKGAVPSERLLEDICDKFNVNRDWLESGNGEMFITLSQNQILADFMTDLLKEEKPSFRKRFIEAFAALDSSDWEDLERIAMKIIKKD